MSRARIHDTHSVLTRKKRRRDGVIIYIARHVRPGVFYNLLCDAISIGDRSISRRVHAPRIAIAHTRMYGDAGMPTYTRARTRERSRKDESTSFARVPTCISLFPRCYANERASRSSKTAILGRTSSSQRQRFELRLKSKMFPLDMEGKRDPLSLSLSPLSSFSLFLYLNENSTTGSTINSTKFY